MTGPGQWRRARRPRPRARAALPPALLALALLLTGCWDARDLDQRAFAVMLGIDRTDGGGYRVTAQLSVGAPHGEATPQMPTHRVLSGDGATIREALHAVHGQLYRELNLDQVGVVVISPPVAAEGLATLDWVVRELVLPPTAFMAVSRQSAAAVLRAGTPALTIPALYPTLGLSGIFTRNPAALPMGIWKLFYRLGPSPLEDEYLPGLTAEPEGINFAGMAILSNGRFRGWLDPFEAELFAVLKRSHLSGYLLRGPVQGRPDTAAALRPLRGKAELRVALEGDAPVLQVRLQVRGPAGQLVGFQIRDPADERLVEQGLAAAEDGRIRAVLRRLQGMEADVFGFGELLRRWQPDHPLVQDPGRWRAAYARARVDVQVEVDVISPGYID